MKVLFIRFNALGDIVLTTGLLHYIKQQRPDIEIEFATSEHFSSLLSDCDFIDKIHLLSKGASPRDIREVAKKLPRYDAIFDLHGVLKSRIFCYSLKGKKYRIKKNSLARRLFVKFRLMGFQLNRHIVEKYADLCLPVLKIPEAKLEELKPHFSPAASPLNDSFSLPEKYIVLHPFASQKNKEWPDMENLAQMLSEAKIPTVVIGQGKGLWPHTAIDLTNRTSLKEMKSIIAHSSLTVTTDSGPMHLSIAYNRPTISLFGPTTKELGFLPTFENSHVFQDESLKCRPCHIHGGQRCPLQHFNCMRNIKAAMVYNKIGEILK